MALEANHRLVVIGTTLKGVFTNTGPCKSHHLLLSWSGQPVETPKMADVDLVGGDGATIDMDYEFEVLDVGQLTAFTKVNSEIEMHVDHMLLDCHRRNFGRHVLSFLHSSATDLGSLICS
jgi:hypothetical protein